MTPQEYQQLALKTLSERDVVLGPVYSRLLHVGLGLCTEAGEFNDNLKKAFFYGRIVNVENLHEELGDVLWYIAIGCHSLGIDLETLMAANIAKLQVRYPNKFKDVEVRDTEEELKALQEQGYRLVRNGQRSISLFFDQQPLGAFVQDVDGDYYFWPNSSLSGAYSLSILNAITQTLKICNETNPLGVRKEDGGSNAS
jgi:NTP pyrophosphatase (non-canonical NTP hydrolase)